MRSTLLMVFLAGLPIGCDGKGSATNTSPGTSPIAAGTADKPTAAPEKTAATDGKAKPGASPVAAGTADKPTTAAPAKTTTADGKEKLKVEIAKARVSIHGTAVTLPAKLDALEKLLGKPSGTDESGVYRAVYWKDIGVQGLQGKGDNEPVVTLSFCFEPFLDKSSKGEPKPFTGTITLEEQPVTKSTNPADLGKKLPDLKKGSLGWRMELADKTVVYVVEGFKTTAKITLEKLR